MIFKANKRRKQWQPSQHPRPSPGSTRSTRSCAPEARSDAHPPKGPPGEGIAPFAVEEVNLGLRGGLPRDTCRSCTAPFPRDGRAWPGPRSPRPRHAANGWRYDPSTASIPNRPPRLASSCPAAVGVGAGAVEDQRCGSIPPGSWGAQRAGPGDAAGATRRAIKAFTWLPTGVCTMIRRWISRRAAPALARVRGPPGRLQRIVEGTEIALLLLAAEPIAPARRLSIRDGLAAVASAKAGVASGEDRAGSGRWNTRV